MVCIIGTEDGVDAVLRWGKPLLILDTYCQAPDGNIHKGFFGKLGRP